MTSQDLRDPDRPPAPMPVWRRSNVLAGLMFMGFAVFGLWISWDYSVGTAVRMGTGYVPRLMLWGLLGLGVVILIMGLRERGEGEELGDPPLDWRPLVLIPAALLVFAFTLEDWGLLIAGILMIVVGGFAFRGSRPIEVAISAVALVLFVWAIFIYALGLTIPVWPGG